LDKSFKILVQLFAFRCSASSLRCELFTPFQSYQVDAIGQVSRSWRLEMAGDVEDREHFRTLQHLYHETHPFYFTSPDWFLFIGHNFHALPPMRLFFNWTERMTMEPPVLHFRDLTVMEMSHFNFVITNTMETANLTIGQVSPFSRDVHFLDMANTVLRPGQSYDISGYICPLSAGSSSAIALIWTNFGMIPYSISYTAVEREVEIGISKLYRPYALRNTTLQVFVSENREAPLAVFDASLMNIDIVPGELEIRGTWASGLHVTFVTLSWPQFSRIVPIFLKSSSQRIQPVLPVFIVPAVTRQDERGECSITVENPTDGRVDLSALRLAGPCPANVAFESPRSRVRMESRGFYFLGKVVITASRPGPVQVRILVDMTSIHEPRQTIEIPVRGYVALGTIHPSVSVITIVASIARDFNFTFQNGFNETLAVFAVRCNSGLFEFPSFRPFVVAADAESPLIRIVLSLPVNQHEINDSLIIETNITRFVFELNGYSGQITVSELENAAGSANEKLSLNLREVVLNSCVNVSVWVHNHNPASCASDPDRWSFKGVSGPFLADFTVRGLKSQHVLIPIQFPSVGGEGEQTGEIHFGLVNNSAEFEITFKWIPAGGEL
jgi:hypothetical protein